jgi:nitrogen fixation NifU-like protein
MFSDSVIDHFDRPRNVGELADATARVEVSNPVCGDVLRLAAKIDSGRIVEVRFLCRGCTTAIACASKLTEMTRGSEIKDLSGITADVIAAAIGELPAATYHAAQLAGDAVAALGVELRKADSSAANGTGSK